MRIERILGFTGNPLEDGVLTSEQQSQLDSIQIRAADLCLEYLDNPQTEDSYPLIAMATGIGKGKIIHKIIENQVRNKAESKILLIAGTKIILVDQTHKALAGYIESEDNDEITSETTDIDNVDLNGESFLYNTGKIGSETNVHIAKMLFNNLIK